MDVVLDSNSGKRVFRFHMVNIDQGVSVMTVFRRSRSGCAIFRRTTLEMADCVVFRSSAHELLALLSTYQGFPLFV